jgi:superfamily II DNA or RNA helicase
MKYYSVIYTYTTPLRTPKGRVKVGSARRKATSAYETARIRIAEQSTAISSDDPAKILEVFNVNDLCETGGKRRSLSNLRTLEQTFLHKNMKNKGMWFAGDQDVDVKDTSEWFFADTVQDVVTEVKSQLNQKRHGVARPNSYTMRDEQKECHDTAVDHFKTAGSYQFLINGKMRFGKTFVSYQIVKSLAKFFSKKFKVLVLTYKPTVEAGWEEDLRKHVDFDGWGYTYAKGFDKNNHVELGDADVEVLFASFQDLNKMDKDKWKNIKNYHFDMVIIDEQHYGTQTENAQKTLETISFDRILEVSGTPLHALMSGKFMDDEIYSWTYADEQRKRLAEKKSDWATDIYRWLPVMKFMVFEINEDAKKQCSFYDDVEGFTMNKMFASDDGETFIDEAAVTMWLEQVYQVGHKNKSPIRSKEGKNSNHMVWKLPSVNSCLAMERLLKRLDYVKHVPKNVSGPKGDDLSGVKKHIRKHDKTVTLTCGSLMTGTTVPEWDMIFMLDSGSSAQEYFQTIFRVQSMNKAAGKEMCYVVDYNPQRNIQMIYNYSDVQSDVNGKSTQQNVQEFLDFAPILDHTGNKPVAKKIDDILSIITPATEAENFRSRSNFDARNPTQEIIDILSDVKQDTKSEKSVEVNDNGIGIGTNKTKNENRKQPTVDQTSKQQRELEQKATTVIKSIPKYLWLETKKVDNINDIVYINNTALFEREVGITIEDFEKLWNVGFLKEKKINRRISSFQQVLKKFSIA